MFKFLPDSVLQMGTIYLSIVIEALPFVLLGCMISGVLQVFLTPERVNRFLPKNKFLAVVVGSLMGFFFPSCECGIVPIVNQFIRKGVPEHTAFAFMLTAPIINPVVIFSTYIAFSDSTKYAMLRVVGSLVVALIVGSWIAYFNTIPIKKELAVRTKKGFRSHHRPQEEAKHHEQGKAHEHAHPHDGETYQAQKGGLFYKFGDVLVHALDEFFDTGRYLMIGGLIASAMQVYLPTSALLTIMSSKLLAILVLLLLAFTMSLCSEADAFIGSSLLSLFGTAPVVAFLVFGPMVDIKNLLMMKRYFNGKFIVALIALIVVCVTGYAYLV
jgi:uncharacterized membrane protein YraQ (UPF0718 family)